MIIFETRQIKIAAGEHQWCMRLCDSWREIGLDQETVTERIDALSKHLDKFWEGLIDEEEEYITAVRERVEKVHETRRSSLRASWTLVIGGTKYCSKKKNARSSRSKA